MEITSKSYLFLSDYDIKTVKLEGEPFIMTSSIDPVYPSAIPAGSQITITSNIFTYKGLSKVSATFDGVTFPMSRQSQNGMQYVYTGTYTIPPTKVDKDFYDVRVIASATDASSRTNILKAKVSTPVNVTGTINPYEIKKGQEGTLTATTSNYVSAVTATLFYNTAKAVTVPLVKGKTVNDVTRWTTKYKFNQNVSEGQYNVRFDASTTNGNTDYYITDYKFIPNQPPKVEFINHSPGFIYEGDDVVLNFRLHDPDGDALDVDVEIYTPSNTLDKAYSESGIVLKSDNSTTYQVPIPKVKATDYTVRLVASDPLGEKASTQTQFSAANLSVSGRVRHTKRWNENRIAFNQSKTQTDEAPRTYQHFWPGERFELLAESTHLDENASVSCEFVTVEILNENRKGGLNQDGGSLSLWSGDLWDKDMLDWKDKGLTFKFTAKYSNGKIKTDEVEVILDNSEPYWRIHRLY